MSHAKVPSRKDENDNHKGLKVHKEDKSSMSTYFESIFVLFVFFVVRTLHSIAP